MYRSNTTPATTPPNVATRSYANVHTWKCNVIKAARDLGVSYTSYSGVLRPARSIKTGCPRDCSYECHLNFDQVQRERIHKHFWSLGADAKHQFYLQMVNQMQPKRKRVAASSVRSNTYVYHFELASERRLQVCSRFFFSTLDVNRKRLYRVFDKAEHRNKKCESSSN